MAFLGPLLAGVAGPLLGKIFHFKEGGMVGGGRKGKPQLAVVHTGERVLTDKQNKVYEAVMKKSGKPVSKRVVKKPSGRKTMK
jgi:hypothetical protein